MGALILLNHGAYACVFVFIFLLDEEENNM